MRTHPLEITGCFLFSLLLAGCRETSTDPQGGASADELTGPRRGMSATVSSTTGHSAPFHFVANGPFAQACWFTEPDVLGNSLDGCVMANRSGTTSDPLVFMGFSVERCQTDFGCTFVASGFGPIPPDDLTNGVQRLKLTTNTSTNPDFAGTGGLVSVEWEKVPGFELRQSGTSQLRMAGLIQHFHGTSTRSSARAAGSVVGFSITPSQAGAEMGISHAVEVDIARP